MGPPGVLAHDFKPTRSVQVAVITKNALTAGLTLCLSWLNTLQHTQRELQCYMLYPQIASEVIEVQCCMTKAITHDGVSFLGSFCRELSLLAEV